MECFLLGSGGMMPMPYRYLTSLVVRLQGAMYMFDAGEGTQIALKKAAIGIKNLRVLALSHLHGDHCLGIPGILMMRAQLEEPCPLTILGPPGTEDFLKGVHQALRFHLSFPLNFLEWSQDASQEPYKDDLVRISWAPLSHTTFCLGFRLEEHQRPGKFRPDSARKLGVPQGPLWGELQKGREVLLENGTRVSPGQVTGNPRRGRSLCYAVDTKACKGLYRLCREVDLAFLDGMFLPQHSQEAAQKGHMTVEDAARVASRANARRAVLVHLSPRYREESELKALEEAARERHPEAQVGKDLTMYSIALPD
jgi:ribonuclease Z